MFLCACLLLQVSPAWSFNRPREPSIGPLAAQDDSEQLNKAKKLLDEGRLDEALEVAKGLEENHPDQIDTLIVLGQIYLAQGAGIQRFTGFAGHFRRDLLGQAEEAFRRALKMDGGHIDARNHLAFTLFLLRNVPAARDQLEEVLKQDGENVYANYLLAEILLHLGSPEEAVDAFRLSLAKNPMFTDSRIGLVRALTTAEQPDDAAGVLLELIRDEPNLAEAAYLAYMIYESKELLSSAADLYRAIVERTPERFDIRFLLGHVAYRLGRLEEGETQFDAVLAAEPEHDGALYFKGRLLVSRENLEDGEEMFIKSANAEGDYMLDALYQLHALALRHAGSFRFDKAVQLLDFVIAMNPADSVALSNRALTLMRSGNSGEADAAFRNLTELEPWESSHVNNYALFLLGTGRTEEGLAMLDRAAKMDGNPDAVENLGSYHFYTTEKLEEADRLFLKVLASNPERSKSLVLHTLIRRRIRTERD